MRAVGGLTDMRRRISNSSLPRGYGTSTLSRKRSRCASGSGYTPSDSIGFWVAITMKGCGTGWVLPPIETCFSAISSSIADCTLAGARLISSASTKLTNTGPSEMSKRSCCAE